MARARSVPVDEVHGIERFIDARTGDAAGDRRRGRGDATRSATLAWTGRTGRRARRADAVPGRQRGASHERAGPERALDARPVPPRGGDQVQTLDAGLLALERDNQAPSQLEACMRAAHSLKGAARIVGLDAGVEVAHAMEDCFVAAQRGTLRARTGADRRAAAGRGSAQRIAQTPEAQLGEWTGSTAAGDRRVPERAARVVARDAPTPAAAPAQPRRCRPRARHRSARRDRRRARASPVSGDAAAIQRADGRAARLEDGESAIACCASRPRT